CSFWPHNFDYRLRVSLGPGGDFILTSRIRNTSTDGKPFLFTTAYHTYFPVQISVKFGWKDWSLELTIGEKKVVITKLLAAANKYDLNRLRRMCESHLCKDISVNSVGRSLALADCHHAIQLK
ncbi:hypothetical protein Ccrd_013643, partial [Cynara cardunculus var. scolymus]